jgi:alcohol dehydrogenase, propanol-preferring
MRDVETVRPLAPLPKFSRKVDSTRLYDNGQRLNVPKGEEFELNVVRVAENHRRKREWLLDLPDAGVLDSEFVEPGGPRLETLTRACVERHVVQARARFVEAHSVVADVRVEPDHPTRPRLDDDLGVAGLLAVVMGELHRHPVRSQHTLVPDEAGLQIGDRDGQVMDSGDAGCAVFAHVPVSVPERENDGAMTASTMRTWRVRTPGPMHTRPLDFVRTDVPEPADGEILVAVRACGVCRTDLHVTEGDLPAHRPHVTPGHEVVGEVAAAGPGDTEGYAIGDLVGVAWLRHTCGRCRFCTRGQENLCPESKYTGWDADGGYAEYVSAPAAYVHRLPSGYSDAELAPLLCAGIIGYRSLLRTELPPGGRLGIYGFGGSAHITAQVALAQGAEVHVMTRGGQAQELALALGASSAQGARDRPPVELDAAILFAPVGDLVPPALEALDRGGTLAVAGIHLSDIPGLNYQRHLFQERTLRSVTSNTRADAREFLAFADAHRIEVTSPRYPLDQADVALTDLSSGRIAGAAVLMV